MYKLFNCALAYVNYNNKLAYVNYNNKVHKTSLIVCWKNWDYVLLQHPMSKVLITVKIIKQKSFQSYMAYGLVRAMQFLPHFCCILDTSFLTSY